MQKPFGLKIAKPAKPAELVADKGIIYHPIFWGMKGMNKKCRSVLMQLSEHIFPETGILAQKFSDGRVCPLSKKQLAIVCPDATHSVLETLRAYGVLAEIKTAKTEMYAVNPMVVSKGTKVNPFLMYLFNKETLSRFGSETEYFNAADEVMYQSFWRNIDDRIETKES